MCQRKKMIKQMVGERVFVMMKTKEWIPVLYQARVIQAFMQQHSSDTLLELLGDEEKCKQTLLSIMYRSFL